MPERFFAGAVRLLYVNHKKNKENYTEKPEKALHFYDDSDILPSLTVEKR